jgi:hypothetical protein
MHFSQKNHKSLPHIHACDAMAYVIFGGFVRFLPVIPLALAISQVTGTIRPRYLAFPPWFLKQFQNSFRIRWFFMVTLESFRLRSRPQRPQSPSGPPSVCPFSPLGRPQRLEFLFLQVGYKLFPNPPCSLGAGHRKFSVLPCPIVNWTTPSQRGSFPILSRKEHCTEMPRNIGTQRLCAVPHSIRLH